MDQSKTQVITHNGLNFVPYISRDKIDQAVKRVAAQISDTYRDKFPIFVGILNGAFVFTSDLVRNLDFIELQIEFCKVSSYTGTESQGEVKQLIGMKQSIKGRHIILVEDIVDSGVTMKALLKSLSEQEPASLAICTLFQKPACMKVELKIDYIGLVIEPEFIVGYGLDFDEWGRNIPDVWHLRKEEGQKEIEH